MIKKLMVYANLSDQLEGLYMGILLLIALAVSTSLGANKLKIMSKSSPGKNPGRTGA
jgi:hypothetical protein